MKPRVTVLLAVHDGEPYVGAAVESVLDQTFGDFEFLIVDDASTDATVAIVESFGDPRIRILRNETNLGQVPSLNRGLREAQGEYVARIDHDDRCRRDRLERQIAVLDAEPTVAVVGSWLDLVDGTDRPLGRLRSSIADFVEFVFHTLIMRVYVSHPAALYRLAPALDAGGYDEATGPAEDKDLWRKFALARWDARIVQEPLLVYRVHDAQLSRARAKYQREVDARSQDRFLSALAPGIDVRPLRLLLADDALFWRETPPASSVVEALDRLLAGAADVLRLDAGEAARLEQLVADRLLAVAARRPWRTTARGLAADALRRVSPDRRSAARASFLRSAAAAPALYAARGAFRLSTRAAAAVPGMGAIRESAQRSRVARRLYEKAVGGGA